MKEIKFIYILILQYFTLDNTKIKWVHIKLRPSAFTVVQTAATTTAKTLEPPESVHAKGSQPAAKT